MRLTRHAPARVAITSHTGRVVFSARRAPALRPVRRFSEKPGQFESSFERDER